MNSRNAPDYLVDAVRSVLWQTYDNIELIVSEAFDSEEGVQILQAFNDQRIIVVRDIDRRGWGHGINLAAEQATGAFILFCAGDDIFHPSAVERMVDALNASTAGTVVVPVRGIDARGVPLGRTIVVPPHVHRERTWVRLCERNYIVVALSRREVLPNPLIDETISGVGADWNLWLDLVLRGTGFTYLDEFLFDYRVHNRSLVATEANTRTDMRNVLARIGESAIRAAYERSGLSREEIEEGLANVAITMGDYAAALRYWARRADLLSDVRAAAQTGTLHILVDDLARAETALRRAATRGAMPEAWNNLGVVLERTGKTSEAQACFREALRQFPLYQDAQRNLAGERPLLVTERLLRPVDEILR
jgi:glycosyltransferase involved in cell wall biosynthesis